MKLLPKWRRFSKHREREKLIASDFDRARLLYRLLEVLANARPVNRWWEAELGAYGDRRQTDHMRSALADERLTGQR